MGGDETFALVPAARILVVEQDFSSLHTWSKPA